MKLKILVFDQEHSLRELLRTILAAQGHEVMAFSDPTVCPLFGNLLNEQCCCIKEHPCADAVLIDIKMPSISALDFLKLQRRRGCKALDANKAVMSASMTRDLEEAIQEFGAHHIKKPFRLTEIKSWINECAGRLAAVHQPPA
ncbi:MAG: response regulator [Desulfuromonadales bacterium]|nr:response regulator [Desulfuromonadales bacterium]